MAVSQHVSLQKEQNNQIKAEKKAFSEDAKRTAKARKESEKRAQAELKRQAKLAKK
jgi:hypothetical protein